MDIIEAENQLCEIHNILENKGVRMWLCGGTLLGAYRDHHLISYDNDIDLLILAEDYSRISPEDFKGYTFKPVKHHWNKVVRLDLEKNGIKTSVFFLWFLDDRLGTGSRWYVNLSPPDGVNFINNYTSILPVAMIEKISPSHPIISKAISIYIDRR